ncbi:VOC family protein [Pseudooceanicola sp. C21-150M6]|uniref:VOC family protein n=1 Tax=Pseudooceanicola sp. C21-150M6 TaxID=3434355 RepID=UPI003D800068
MSLLELDHIVVVANPLDRGVAHVKEMTGLDMPFGGEHPLMGTHNHLMRLGEAEFLEVIAVNPEAPDPGRIRWFGLDRTFLTPWLAHWVVRCRDMEAIRPYLTPEQGQPIPVTRGDLSWLLTVPDDGGMGMEGVLPSVIQWNADPLPPTRMQGAGAELRKLTLSHPRIAEARDWLAPLFDDPRVVFEEGLKGLTAEIAIGDRVVTLK